MRPEDAPIDTFGDRDDKGADATVELRKDPDGVLTNAFKWGNEAYLRLLTPENFGPTDILEKKETHWEIISSDRVTKYVWFETPEGDLEYEIHLASHPGVNQWELDMEFPVGLDFKFQPALTQFEIDRGNIRPDRVVGSYAVYWFKKDNVYKTGKFCHIYRPTARDASRRSIVGTLNINPVTAKLLITVPNVWLDSAVFPVVIEPTIGYDTLGASTDNTGAYLMANRFASSFAGDADDFFFGGYTSSGGGPLDVMGAVYENGNTSPNGNAKLSGDATISVDGTSGWHSAPIVFIGIEDAVNYWVSINGDSAGSDRTRTLYDSGYDPDQHYFSRVHGGTMPDPWPLGGGSLDWVMSMYFTGTESGGGGVDIIVPLETLALNDQIPIVASGVNAIVPVKVFILADLIPVVSKGVNAVTPVKSFNLSGSIPTVNTGLNILVPTEALNLNTQIPVVGTGVNVPVPVDLLSIGALIPEVEAGSAGPVIQIPTKAFTLGAQVPLVASGVNLNVPLKAFVLVPRVPFISSVNEKVINVPIANLNLAYPTILVTADDPDRVDFNLNLTPPIEDIELHNFLVENFDALRQLLTSGDTNTFTTADGKTVVVQGGITKQIQ